MNTIWHLTKKNLKLLIRAKGSALIVIFAPLLLMLIIGLSYDTNDSFDIAVGVYAADFNLEVEDFVVLLEEDFNVVKFTAADDCVNGVKRSLVNACLELPSGFTVDSNEQKNVIFHVDPSRVNLVYSIQQSVASKFDLKAQEISEALTGNILSLLADTNSRLGERSSEVSAVSEKSKSAVASTSGVEGELSSIDVSYAGLTFDTAALKTISGKVKDSKDKIASAKSDVSSSALTDDEKKGIEDALKDASLELDAVSNALDNSTGSISSLVFGLEKELIVTREKLMKADVALSSVKSNVGSVSSTLGEVESALSSLSSSLTEMKSSLDGLKVTEAGVIANPLQVTVVAVEEGTYLNFLFPALLILVVMFSSLLLGTSLVMMEKNSPAYVRNYFVPARRFSFVASIYFTNLILILFEILIILGIASIFLPEMYLVLPLMVLILFILASVFTLLGMGIGYLFTSEETGILASISLGSLLLFVSGLILPLEGLSTLAREIVKYNPFVIGEKLLREVLVFGTKIAELGNDFYLIIGYAVGLMVIVVILESVLYKHLVHRFMRRHRRKKHGK